MKSPKLNVGSLDAGLQGSMRKIYIRTVNAQCGLANQGFACYWMWKRSTEKLLNVTAAENV